MLILLELSNFVSSPFLLRHNDDNAQRLRQLDDFSHAKTDLATCRRQRDDLSRLADRGEELLKRADAYLEALVH